MSAITSQSELSDVFLLLLLVLFLCFYFYVFICLSGFVGFVHFGGGGVWCFVGRIRLLVFNS